AGNPNVVYLMGSFDYGQDHVQSNARAVLLSTDSGATFSDLTQDSDPTHAEFTHPDQHAIVVNPNNPFQYWEGSDGGIVRSDGQFSDVSYKCDQRGLSPADDAYCKSLLNRVPHELSNVLNAGLSTLQFQSLSAAISSDGHGDHGHTGSANARGAGGKAGPQDDGHGNGSAKLQGGTQDNGTWNFTGSTDVWPQEIYGDGGQSGFSASDSTHRVNTFTGQANDVNFRDGDPTAWVIASGPIINSPEGSYFYPPVLADPNPANGGTIFQGSFSVWRTQDWAGNQAYLEANCPEFTTSATAPNCGDFVQIGPTGNTDLTSAFWGATRRGGAVSVIARSTAASNLGTAWVATGAGRIFISDNVNAAAGAVAWTRIDQTAANSPTRFPANIYVDPANGHHAWVVYSGYNENTPTTPGHVFDVTWNGTVATYTSLDGTNFPDLPGTSIAHDDVNGDLYVANDFGVLRLASGSSTWTVAGSGLPMVEVPNLNIIPSARLLLAATHGRSAWVLQLH
ncbi:MAG: exo-alpha-sialidase, partial [Acidobacteria bacterium]|nr:exo-alpha-sialidase [Acidobacteriota bacterium]